MTTAQINVSFDQFVFFANLQDNWPLDVLYLVRFGIILAKLCSTV